MMICDSGLVFGPPCIFLSVDSTKFAIKK